MNQAQELPVHGEGELKQRYLQKHLPSTVGTRHRANKTDVGPAPTELTLENGPLYHRIMRAIEFLL